MTQHEEASFPAGRIALVVCALIAAFAVGFAVSKGQMGGTSAPASEQEAQPAEQSLQALEARTRAEPDNAEAWRKLGFAYAGENRFADAATAYRRAVQIDGDDASLWSALGEALIYADQRDPMPDEAARAFAKAIAIDPTDPRARYFRAVEKDLDGDHEGAIADWLALLKDTPADAPWHGDVVRTIEQVGKINGIDVSARLAQAGAQSPSAPVAVRAIPGPSAQDLAAASAMRPDDQRDMAEGMVARLEERLKGDPGNVNGWIMLMRSRMTLDQPDKASKALADALAANPARADFIRQQAKILGVP